MTDIYSTVLLLLSFIPFVLFVFFDTKANLKKEIRNKQFFMPIAAVVISIVLFIFMSKLSNLFFSFFSSAVDTLNDWATKAADISYLSWSTGILEFISKIINDFLTKLNITYVMLVLFNVCSMFLYIIAKKFVLLFFSSKKKNSSLTNKIVSIFYDYDEKTQMWYIKEHFGQAKTFLKTAFYATTAISAVAVFVSFYLCKKGLIAVPFYPIFPIIIMGEMAFFIDGLEYSQLGNVFSADIDKSRHVINYVLLRKKLKDLFGDKLTADGTTLNDSIGRGGSIDQILEEIEKEYGKPGENYASFIRKKAISGLNTSPDYVRSGIELSSGKSLLFNTPFYYKLTPYLFYAMHDALLKGGKLLIVLGRHGTAEDVAAWCNEGFYEVTGLPSLWDIKTLDKEGEPCDVGIVTRSGVYDLELHKANREFLNGVSFVFIVEPSRLVTTAQIGLNLLVRNISVSNNAVYCSVDKNCDGLVDSLSHILMTNITEVSATEFPEGTSSYMCWKADGEHLQHRLTPGISRYLGVGTELSFTALKNHVEKVIWYGGDAYPVLDQHWIAKQYYHDLLSITPLPTTQETFDKYFKVSFNFCNEKIKDNSFISVEDEFCNLFEVRREFSTIARNQGFVNVISSEYMLRGYMTENNEVFLADPKAIPYISADYARTKRNIILKICLQMSILGISKEEVIKEFTLIDIKSPEAKLRETIWQNICSIYCSGDEDEIVLDTEYGRKIFTVDTILYKREFSVEKGKFEDLFVIKDPAFKQYVIDDLQSARYVAEKGNESAFIGTELKGHVLQKYLPGQFITLSGKYYEMLSVTSDNLIIVRRAADHIKARYTYRQIRKINLQSARDNEGMGMLKTVNGVKIYNQFADFTVDTPAYWRMHAYNDFENANKVVINNVPQRKYINKHILKIDFSSFGEEFTNEVRATLPLLMNEIFRTMFAENQPFIVAVTAGEYEKPLTYSLEGDAVEDNCIYIIEDSQLDIGLLVTVERNFERIMHIIADYLDWNNEQFTPEKAEEKSDLPEIVEEPTEQPEKNPIKRGFNKVKSFFGKLFGKKNKDKKKKKKKKKGKGADQDTEADDLNVVEASEPELEPEAESEPASENQGNDDTNEADDTSSADTAGEIESKEPMVEEDADGESASEESAKGAVDEVVSDSAAEDGAADEDSSAAIPEENAELNESTESEVASEPASEENSKDSKKKKKKRKGFFGWLFGKKDKKKSDVPESKPSDMTEKTEAPSVVEEATVEEVADEQTEADATPVEDSSEDKEGEI